MTSLRPHSCEGTAGTRTHSQSVLTDQGYSKMSEKRKTWLGVTPWRRASFPVSLPDSLVPLDESFTVNESDPHFQGDVQNPVLLPVGECTVMSLDS